MAAEDDEEDEEEEQVNAADAFFAMTEVIVKRERERETTVIHRLLVKLMHASSGRSCWWRTHARTHKNTSNGTAVTLCTGTGQ